MAGSPGAGRGEGAPLNDTGRAADIIARIRTMATRGIPQRMELSLHDTLNESLMFLRGELQSKHISVDLELTSTVPLVIGDQTQLQQVIVNLTVNAIQAMARSTGSRKVLIRTTLADARVE